MKSDTTRYDQEINLAEAFSMGDPHRITKLLRNVSVIPKLKVCMIPNSHRRSWMLLQLLQRNRGRHEQIRV